MFKGPVRPDGKKEVYYFQLEKLRIMLSFYNKAEFEVVRFHKLNSDQILQFLDCPNFLAVARKEKVIQALKQIQKSRELNLYKRPEILEAIKSISLDHSVLAGMES